MRSIVLVGLCCLLSACIEWEKTDFATSDKDQYLYSKNGKDLIVPPPLTNSNLSDFYVLPDQNQNAKIGVESPVEK